MKKYKKFLIFLLFCIPFFVNAKEYCKVVSGNGKDIGSEIACGSEHFYIIDSNEDEIKMLAKYNLYTGVTIYKDKIEKEEGDTRSDSQYCSDLAASKGGTVKSDDFYNAPGYCFYTIKNKKEYIINLELPYENGETRSDEEICREYVQSKNGEYIQSSMAGNPMIRKVSCQYKITNDNYNLLQNEEAKSAHWDMDLNYLYPQVGDVYMEHVGAGAYYEMYYEDGISKNDSPLQEESAFYDFNINLDHLSDDIVNYVIDGGNTKGITKPLFTYKYLLGQMGYTINNISLLSISELDEIINKISNKRLPLKEWELNYDVTQNQNRFNLEIQFGNLKPFIPNNYSWLYSTTYWNSTVFEEENTFYHTYFVFTAEQGKLCGAGFTTCAPETTLGCGIRPVITIPNELEYLINTETDGNGVIETIENSIGGEKIEFKVTSNKGYKLSKIIIKTDSGETLKFNEGEIIENEDGTVSIDKNRFTMPFENVTIEASWKKENAIKEVIDDILVNPKTGNVNIIPILILIGILFSVVFLFVNKKKKLYRS